MPDGQQDLRSSHGRLQAVLLSASSILIALDQDGLVLLWNSGAEKIFGIGEDATLGRPFLRCPIRWDWDRVAAQVPGCVPGRETRIIEQVTRADGSHGTIAFQIKPQFRAGTTLTGCLWLGADSGNVSARLAPAPRTKPAAAPRELERHHRPPPANLGQLYPVHLAFLDSHLVAAGEDPASWRIMHACESRLDEQGMAVSFTLTRRYPAQGLIRRTVLVASGELISVTDG